MHIIVFGDSNEYGATDWKNGGWVQLLKSHCERTTNYNTFVYNCGVSGDSSRELLERMEVELKARFEKDGRNVIIIAIGSNDSYYFDGNPDNANVSPDEYSENLRKLVVVARKYVSDIFMLGVMPIDNYKVQPVPWRTDISYSNENAERYNTIAKETAEIEGVSFLDVFNIFNKMDFKEILSDGAHFSEYGHRLFFEHVLIFLKENKVLE